jgi:ABC-type amino acid transport substrate-binding protein
MKKATLFLSFIIMASLLLTGCGAGAGSHLEKIQEAGVIKVGTSADYPPFEYVDEQGNKVGFDIELMQEIANRMGVELEWVDMPFDSLIAGVQEGKISVRMLSRSPRASRVRSRLPRTLPPIK